MFQSTKKMASGPEYPVTVNEQNTMGMYYLCLIKLLNFIFESIRFLPNVKICLCNMHFFCYEYAYPFAMLIGKLSH